MCVSAVIQLELCVALINGIRAEEPVQHGRFSEGPRHLDPEVPISFTSP